jgi:hypothetical protein
LFFALKFAQNSKLAENANFEKKEREILKCADLKSV